MYTDWSQDQAQASQDLEMQAQLLKQQTQLEDQQQHEVSQRQAQLIDDSVRHLQQCAADEKEGKEIAQHNKLPRVTKTPKDFLNFNWQSTSRWGVKELRFLNVDYEEVHDIDSFLNFKDTSPDGHIRNVDYQEDRLKELLDLLDLTPAEFTARKLAAEPAHEERYESKLGGHIYAFYTDLAEVVKLYKNAEQEFISTALLKRTGPDIPAAETLSGTMLSRVVDEQKDLPPKGRVRFNLNPEDEDTDIAENAAGPGKKGRFQSRAQPFNVPKLRKKEKKPSTTTRIIYQDFNLFTPCSERAEDSSDSRDMQRPDDEAYTRGMSKTLIAMVLMAARADVTTGLKYRDGSSNGTIKIYGAPGTPSKDGVLKSAKNDGYLAVNFEVHHKPITIPLCNIECKAFATSRGMPNQVKLCSQVLGQSIAIQRDRSNWNHDNKDIGPPHEQAGTVFTLMIGGRRASMTRLEFSDRYESALVRGNLPSDVNIVMQKSLSYRLDKPDQLQQFVTLFYRFIRQLFHQIQHENRIV